MIKIRFGATIIILLVITGIVNAQNKEETRSAALAPPILLENNQRIAGNPLATYLAMLEMEDTYLNSPLRDIYLEQKLNLEQFMGIADAGPRALQLDKFRNDYSENKEKLEQKYVLEPVLSVLKKEATKNQIIIWGEEHHLPQTRVLYKSIIKILWEAGFRYLAAEAFTQNVESNEFTNINYTSGYYTQDPIFAEAVEYAKELGYTLVAYDNKEQDRDKVQAQTIIEKVFDSDLDAKVFVIAGRGHIAEHVVSDGWKPMGYWLKELTGIDPFTLYAPTMTERMSENEEHPVYKFLTLNSALNEISIILNEETEKYFGTNQFDAYIFFPRVKLIDGRPDWLFSELDRVAVNIPSSLLRSDTMLLVQAFRPDEPINGIPIDQVLLKSGKGNTVLALPTGRFKLRSIDANGVVYGFNYVRVESDRID